MRSYIPATREEQARMLESMGLSSMEELLRDIPQGVRLNRPLDLPEGSYTDLAASLSAMMVQSYGVAIVKPAEGKTQEVVDAMDAYIQNQQQTMEHYLEDQYQIAASAKVATVPTGEVVMVCCENSDAVMNAIKTALAA